MKPTPILLPTLSQTTIPRLRWVLLAAGLLGGPISLLLLRLYPDLDISYHSAMAHFWIVSISTMMAMLLVALVLRAAIVRRDGRALLVGLAFLTLSSMFLVHAISTPGVLFANTGHATQWSTPLALFGTAILLALSTSRRISQQPALVMHWRRWFSLGFVIWLVYTSFMLLYVPAQTSQFTPPASSAATHPNDHAQAAAPVADADAEYAADEYGNESRMVAKSNAEIAPIIASPISAAPTLQQQLFTLAPRLFPFITALNLVLYGYVAVMYGRRWRRTPTRPLAALTIGAILLAETSLAAQFGVVWQLSFWSYHVLLMAAVLVVAYGMVRGAERSGSLSGALEGVLLGSTVERQRRAFADGMTTLLDALENGNRTAMPTLRRDLGTRFGLAEDQLDLLQHAVSVVAQDREQGRRLQALVDISHTVTSDLNRDDIIQTVVKTLAHMTQPKLAAVGIIEDDMVHIKAGHRVVNGQPTTEDVCLPASVLPLTWLQATDIPYTTTLVDGLAPLGVDGDEALLLPLSHHTTLLGVLLFEPQHADEINARVESVLQSVAAHLATALTNDRLYHALQREHEQIQRSEQSKEQMSQLIVHDLKNPLTAIINYLDLLKRDTLTENQTELVDGAWRASRTMNNLVTDLLDSARLQAGRLELRLSTVNLAQMFSNCSADMRSWAAQVGKSITIAVDAGLEIEIDADLFCRVLVNLLSNAIKHTPSDTTIMLNAAADDHGVTISIHDNGPGIPADVLPTLFDRFSGAANQTTNGRQRNSGLGLFFCKLAIEAHKGTINVASSPDEGTTFTIVLPPTVVKQDEVENRR